MKELITQKIREFVARENEKLHIYREPIVGFAKADSEYMESLPEVSEGHGKPIDVLDGAKTVIAYFIPYTLAFNDENKFEGLASESWAKGYEDTNEMIGRLNEYIISEVEKTGFRAVLPPDEMSTFDRENIRSYWSQRHMGYAAGIGTFGLNNMLITEKGCSGRLGSVVADFECEWDEPMKEEQCLHKQSGVCLVCVRNCMSGAISESEPFDREKCYEICKANARVYDKFGSSYGSDIGSEVCGKCISFSPCAYRK